MGYSSSKEAKEAVLRLARPCPYPDWMLLELPTGQWAAFWKDGFDLDHAESIAEGDYSVCFPFGTAEEALAFMAQSDAEDD